MLQALDELSERFTGRVPERTLDAIRDRLEAERDPAGESLLGSGLTGAVAEELRAVRTRIDDWALRREDWKALEPGLDRGYRRGRHAFERAWVTTTIWRCCARRC
jgi:hypothetical protein